VVSSTWADLVLYRTVELGVEGFEVGGYHSEDACSGITVVFPTRNNVAGVAQIGGSPGTRETDILRPLHRKNNSVDAVALCGRSVFGFRAVEGVVERLRVDGKGYRVGGVTVPIVPAAVIFDFKGDETDKHFSDQSWGYLAYEQRSTKLPVGGVWVGRGATVGKILGRERASPSGQGYAHYERGGVQLGVLTVVNAVGDVYGRDGNIIAGARGVGGSYTSGLEHAMREGLAHLSHFGNTTLGVVITNIRADVCDMCALAQAANTGYASVIRPFNTAFDGDTVFALTTNDVDGDFEVAKILTTQLAADSVINIYT
jgi:L-aminopeptidase/D-esterase-like protein